ERGQGQAIAENLMTMMGLKTPILSLLIGEGGSGGALALGVADRVWMLENSVYSVISPEGAASIVWKDAAKAPDASEALHLTAEDLLSFGVVDRVFSEEQGDFERVCESLSQAMTDSLNELCAQSEAQLLQNRYDKFRRIGGDGL
ncbi:MAG: acetyl-CoA carboxylase carboxyl transferase subunit alpha, partial [Eubacteriales bacterium]|nr:acetyl-CoA carboxylase carboxyl transferase subunit alpha [Eubacteriales bacterium]